MPSLVQGETKYEFAVKESFNIDKTSKEPRGTQACRGLGDLGTV